MHKYHSIWNTCEAYCFMRDFTYEDYVYVYERAFPGGKPFSKEFYSQFCSLLNTLMEKEAENTSDKNDN